MRNRICSIGSLGLVAALTLAACGTSGTNSEATASEVDEETTESSIPTSEPTTQAAQTEVEISHFQGTTTVPVDPETVLVMNTGILLTLDSLGVEADAYAQLGIPVPEQYESVMDNPDFPEIGTGFEPDYEAINELEPDLIIVAARSSSTYPEMSKIAPTVDLTFDEGADYFEAFSQQHEVLGQIFDVEEEVGIKLEELEGRIENVKGKTGDAGAALIVLTTGTEVSAYGAGSRFGLVHNTFGYETADDSLDTEATHGDPVSFEFIAEAKPDVMFVVDRASAIGDEGEAAQAILDNDLVEQTPAAVDERLVYVDGFSWYIASNSIQGLDQIISDVESSIS